MCGETQNIETLKTQHREQMEEQHSQLSHDMRVCDLLDTDHCLGFDWCLVAQLAQKQALRLQADLEAVQQVRCLLCSSHIYIISYSYPTMIARFQEMHVFEEHMKASSAEYESQIQLLVCWCLYLCVCISILLGSMHCFTLS